jgi:hypothetical protein
MRPTVDLPPGLHAWLRKLAQERGPSVSDVLAHVAMAGLSRLGSPTAIETDPRSGFPVIDIGRTVTAEEVAAALDEE